MSSNPNQNLMDDWEGSESWWNSVGTISTYEKKLPGPVSTTYQEKLPISAIHTYIRVNKKEMYAFAFNEGKWERGWCLDGSGIDQNSGLIDVGPKDNDYWCLNACKEISKATGCEFETRTKACYAHTQEVASGSGDEEYICFVFESKGFKWTKIYAHDLDGGLFSNLDDAK